MKKVLMLTMCLSLCASVAMADHIGLYNENTGINCFRVAAWQPLGSSVWVIQKFNTGSSGSEFRVNNMASAPLFSVAKGNAAYQTIGDAESGISVAYTMCVPTAQFVILRMIYADPDELGLAPIHCGKMEVVENPGASPPVRQTADCNSQLHPATGGVFYWGNDCAGCADPTATSATTWGGVKALYR